MERLPLIFKRKIHYLTSLSRCRAKTVAFITKGKYKILYCGHNDVFRTQYLNKRSICQHAEMNVLTKFVNSHIRPQRGKYRNGKKYKLQKYRMWVFRLSNANKNKLLNSAPCMHCSKMLRCMGIRKVTHSINDNLKTIDLRFYTTKHASKAQQIWETNHAPICSSAIFLKERKR